MIRFGAVNCQEEWNLCQRQGIQSYPSLVLYPTVSSKLNTQLQHTNVTVWLNGIASIAVSWELAVSCDLHQTL